MSWDWPSRRSSTEKLSNQVTIPWSLTPLTRNIVTGVLERRSALRNRSWREVCLSAIGRSFVIGGLFARGAPVPGVGNALYEARRGQSRDTRARRPLFVAEIGGRSPRNGDSRLFRNRL